MISVGTVLQDGQPLLHRLIHFDHALKEAWLIEMNSRTALPRRIRLDDLEEWVGYGLLKVVEQQHTPKPPRPPSEKAIEIMHRRWERIAPLATGECIANEATRDDALRKRAAQLGVRRHSLMQLLRQFWQGGCNQQALMPGRAARQATGQG